MLHLCDIEIRAGGRQLPPLVTAAPCVATANEQVCQREGAGGHASGSSCHPNPDRFSTTRLHDRLCDDRECVSRLILLLQLLMFSA
jgi:hypothetical protein